MGLTKKLDFVRDRLMEVYFWALGMAPHPHQSECRKAVTKMFGLVTIIDDVYDVYGTLEELQLFTDAVERFLCIFIDLATTVCICVYIWCSHN